MYRRFNCDVYKQRQAQPDHIELNEHYMVMLTKVKIVRYLQVWMLHGVQWLWYPLHGLCSCVTAKMKKKN